MAGSQDARLAVAVAQAGALGSVPAAMLDAAGLQRQLQAVHDAGQVCNVNFFAHTPPAEDAARDARWRQHLAPYAAELGLDLDQAPAGATRRPFGPEAAEVLERFRPPVVSFHFGLPAPALLARFKALGCAVWSSATTVAEALWLQAHGADAVIVQGLEAGGHRGHFLPGTIPPGPVGDASGAAAGGQAAPLTDPTQQAPLMQLLPAVRQAVQLPLIAAGGLGHPAAVQACLDAGAAAVQVGTAFLLCPEAGTGALHRQRLQDPDAPTALTNLFSGGLARGLFNRAMHELGPLCADAPPFPLAAAAIGPLRAAAEAAGRDDFTPLWSGSNRRACRAVPAAQVVQALMDGVRG